MSKRQYHILLGLGGFLFYQQVRMLYYWKLQDKVNRSVDLCLDELYNFMDQEEQEEIDEIFEEIVEDLGDVG